MAEEDWGLEAELQEKLLINQSKDVVYELYSFNNEPIPPPVPPENISKYAELFEKEKKVELNTADVSLLNKLLPTHLDEVTHDIDYLENPNNHLYFVKSFEELNLRPDLLKGVYAMGMISLSKFQEAALLTLITDPPQNMIGQSQSGTGKTAAFILASLSRVDTNLKYPHVLVLTPSYELALRIGNIAKQMAKFIRNIEFCFAVRGEHLDRGSKIQAQFIIGTPGMVFDWAMKFRFFQLRKIKVFVLAEADIMISTQGYHDQSLRIHKQLPKTCQMMLFSATYSKDVMQFAEQIVPDPIILKFKDKIEDTISQYYIECTNREGKLKALSNIYNSISIVQAIVICDTEQNASYVVKKMAAEGHAVAVFSGDLTFEQRITVLNRFREGKEKVLITSNAFIRIIDTEQATAVVNFDLPMNEKKEADYNAYLHRFERVGCFGKVGYVINFVESNKDMSVLRNIEEYFGKEIIKLDFI